MGVYDQNQGYGQGGGSGGGGFTGRIITFAILALVGIFMFMSRVEENPVTGEKQHVAITPDQEIRLGLESAPQMSREMGGELSATDPRTIEVKKMGDFLVANSIAKKSPWKFQFHLLADSKTVNAFALPGGQIFITLGLYSKLQNEAQLAGVLSHEMGHVIERHSAQQMAKSQLGQILVAAVATASATGESGNSSPAMVAAVVNQMFQLRYSRHDESQADLWGIKLMEQVGFDPTAMIDVMNVLKASAGGKGESMAIFQTHPDPDLRIQQINAYLKENPPPPGLIEGEKLPQGGASNSGGLESLFQFPGLRDNLR